MGIEDAEIAYNPRPSLCLEKDLTPYPLSRRKELRERGLKS
jgi:hypothetical protein